MGETAKQLGRELKRGIHSGDQVAPLFACFRLNVSVKRGVNFAAVEVLREELQGMLFLLQPRRINDAFPIFIGEASGSNQNLLRVFRQMIQARPSGAPNYRRCSGDTALVNRPREE